MGSDLTLLIIDPRAGAVVRARWLGMSGTLSRLRDVLARPPTTSYHGTECWADVTCEQVAQIAVESYADGATPAEIDAFAQRFPTPPYWWLIARDY
ncbi:MAG: hypothetical protein HOW73_22610 [Polyangiaceae bacterium]|nr:hypothetical protein [Polyangiaceae bacterium]